MLDDNIKKDILNRLTPLNPERIILFGSRTSSAWDKESDIDLYIVTRDDYIPQTFKEKINIKLKYADALKDLKKKYDIDLIVHTKKMSELFRRKNSLFSHEIFNKGIGLYE